MLLPVMPSSTAAIVVVVPAEPMFNSPNTSSKTIPFF